MISATDIRAEAESLARQLPGLNFKAAASEAAHIGSAGRRRAGTGEQFWQYRRHTQEDAAERIDWRRSARGDDLYVRESELETARTVLFWCDPHPGFHWKSETDTRTKAHEATLLMLTIAILMSKDGERIGALGSGRRPSFGKRAIDRLAEDLGAGTGKDFPLPPRKPATLILASDFYDPLTEWQARLAPLAGQCAEGVLLAVASPVEVAFPFEGRIRLNRPGATTNRILGRAEAARDDYQQRFAAHREGLKDLATRMGWRLASHVTGSPALAGAARLKAEVEAFGVSR